MQHIKNSSILEKLIKKKKKKNEKLQATETEKVSQEYTTVILTFLFNCAEAELNGAVI